MALTKARTVVWAAQSLSDGGGDVASSWVDASTFYSATVMVKITNGTGISTGAKVRVEVAGTDSTPVIYYLTPTYEMVTTAAAVQHWVITLPQAAKFFRIVVTSPIGSTATLDGEYGSVTGI